MTKCKRIWSIAVFALIMLSAETENAAAQEFANVRHRRDRPAFGKL